MCEEWSVVPIELQKDCIAVDFDHHDGHCKLFEISGLEGRGSIDAKLTLSPAHGSTTYVKVSPTCCFFKNAPFDNFMAGTKSF